MSNEFGGDWTEQKLAILDKYLGAYSAIFRKNERAKFFKTIYVDAFAGTGEIGQPNEESEDDQAGLLAGSAQRAIHHSFDKYIFIEKSADRVSKLQELKKTSGVGDKIDIRRGDANAELLKLIKQTDWKTHRAVVFLDPYGMQVDWTTIEAIAATEAIDLWLLFPIGQAVMRLLLKGAKPPPKWSACLDRVLGTSDWKKKFYSSFIQPDLWGGETVTTYRHADWRVVTKFFVERLQSVFNQAHPKPAVLRNSNNTPLYLLCFAAANPKGAKIALKIANHLLKPLGN
jgi:three-Cys-motif partner protein